MYMDNEIIKLYTLYIILFVSYTSIRASLVARAVKNLPINEGDARDIGSIPGLGRSPAVRNGNPLHYSCLKNFMDRGAWRATVHGITKESDTTKHRHIHTHTYTHTHFNKAEKIFVY